MKRDVEFRQGHDRAALNGPGRRGLATQFDSGVDHERIPLRAHAVLGHALRTVNRSRPWGSVRLGAVSSPRASRLSRSFHRTCRLASTWSAECSSPRRWCRASRRVIAKLGENHLSGVGDRTGRTPPLGEDLPRWSQHELGGGSIAFLWIGSLLTRIGETTACQRFVVPLLMR